MESIDKGTKEKLKVRLFKALLFILVAIPSFTFAEQLSDIVFIEEMTWTEVRDAIKDGKTTKQIAKSLNLSHRTIESHRQNIRMKIGAKNRKANLRSLLLSIEEH